MDSEKKLIYFRVRYEELLIRIFYVLFLLSLTSEVFALSRKGEFQSTKVGFVQQNYTGAAKQSFAEGSPSYGVELSIDTGGQHLRYFFKTRVTNSIGSQNFIKNSITYGSKYEYTSIEPELGLSLFPVARKEKSLNLYFWGVGGVSYNNLSIDNVPTTVTGVKSKAQEFGSGYGAGLGFEFILYTSRGGNKFLAYSEVGFRDYRAPIAGLNAFEISGMTMSFGFGF